MFSFPVAGSSLAGRGGGAQTREPNMPDRPRLRAREALVTEHASRRASYRGKRCLGQGMSLNSCGVL